ncbi:MAG: hypothetical protein ACJ764_10430 [Solirubrobacteraceae bacterium]
MRLRLGMVAAAVGCLVVGAAALGDRDATLSARGLGGRDGVLAARALGDRNEALSATPLGHLVARPPWLRDGVRGAPATDSILARLGLAPVPPGSRLPGYLLIADRDNNRLIIVSPSKRIVWRFPPVSARGSRTAQVSAGLLSQPDDAFVSPDGRFISTNQEFAETIKVITLSRHPRVTWAYGHADAQGSAPGYLAHPDDAYLVAGRLIQVADIVNCRVLWINAHRRIVRAIGRAGDCRHDPPNALADPNGDTPTPDGGVLITEIGGWADRLDRHGRLRWSIRTPTDYPSDAQLLPDGNVLVASYTSPGRVDILNPRGRVVWTYEFSSGRRALDHPSLAVALPNGLIALNDDFNHRVLVIDRATKRIVWQYGHDGVAGSRPGYLDNPDGLQLLPDRGGAPSASVF